MANIRHNFPHGENRLKLIHSAVIESNIRFPLILSKTPLKFHRWRTFDKIGLTRSVRGGGGNMGEAGRGLNREKGRGYDRREGGSRGRVRC